jgi:hypothetical protein
MGMFSMAGLVAVGAIFGGIVMDVAINTLQDWYQVVYADALWANRVLDSQALRDLAVEEARVNELLRAASDFADRSGSESPARPAP